MTIGSTAYGRAKQRHNTLANLNLANPVPAAGEIVAAIDGTTTIVRIGDGVTHWTGLENILPHPDGGGGGGGGGAINTAIGYGSQSDTTIVGGFSEAQPTNWSFSDDVGTVGVEGGDFGWGYDEAGFYQVGINYFIGFTGGTPDFMNFELVTYWGDSWSWDVPCFAPASIAGRSFHGAQGTLLTSWHYMPDKVETGTDENANQLTVRWPGTDAILGKGNGTDDSNAVSLYIARFTPVPTP